MSQANAPNTSSSASSPYAALSETAKASARPPDARLSQQMNLSQLLSHYTLSPFYAEEAHRLQALKDQMWQAFQSDPTSTPSLQIFDAARAYTVALNSQLQVIGHRKPKQLPRPAAPEEKIDGRLKSG